MAQTKIHVVIFFSLSLWFIYLLSPETSGRPHEASWAALLRGVKSNGLRIKLMELPRLVWKGQAAFEVKRCIRVNHYVNILVKKKKRKRKERKQHFNRGRHTVNPDFRYCTVQWGEEMPTGGSWFIQTHTHTHTHSDPHTQGIRCLLRVKNKSPLWHLRRAAASFQMHCGIWQYPRQEGPLKRLLGRQEASASMVHLDYLNNQHEKKKGTHLIEWMWEDNEHNKRNGVLKQCQMMSPGSQLDPCHCAGVSLGWPLRCQLHLLCTMFVLQFPPLQSAVFSKI